MTRQGVLKAIKGKVLPATRVGGTGCSGSLWSIRSRPPPAMCWVNSTPINQERLRQREHHGCQHPSQDGGRGR